MGPALVTDVVDVVTCVSDNESPASASVSASASEIVQLRVCSARGKSESIESVLTVSSPGPQLTHTTYYT